MMPVVYLPFEYTDQEELTNMERQTTRVSKATAATIAVFAVSGEVGPFGATASGQTPTDRRAARKRLEEQQYGLSGRYLAPQSRLTEFQDAYSVKPDSANDDIDAHASIGQEIEFYMEAHTGAIRRHTD